MKIRALEGITNLRKEYHNNISANILSSHTGVINIADKSNRSSREIAEGLAYCIGGTKCQDCPSGQTAGTRFSKITRDFLESSFALLQHIRPGQWGFSAEQPISLFEQYRHLSELDNLVTSNPDLKVALGLDYLITPDIVVYREPLTDSDINLYKINPKSIAGIAERTPLRYGNNSERILHASISCKWTMRSDRAQNTRTEALNLIRNRKGHTPIIVAVTAEPLPTRIASLALGTGDLDCVYHFALNELIDVINSIKNDDQKDMLETLINGRRLRDISDLPLDLAIYANNTISSASSNSTNELLFLYSFTP